MARSHDCNSLARIVAKMRLTVRALSLPSPLNILIILGLIRLSPYDPEMAHALLIEIEKVH
jgi:hypothetical protein